MSTNTHWAKRIAENTMLKSLKTLNLLKEVREERKVEGMPTVKYYAPSDFELVLTPRSIRDLYADKNGGEKNA
jgi:hypothetical protein